MMDGYEKYKTDLTSNLSWTWLNKQIENTLRSINCYFTVTLTV